MRRTAFFGHGRGTLAAVALLAGLWACDGQPVALDQPRTRIFRVTEADGQLLPAHQPCPAPVEGMVTGAHFVEGELVLYPERTFTWRFTIQQYATSEGTEQAWLEPVTLQGTYALRGDSLDLAAGTVVVRKGRLVDESVELTEALPCHYPVDGHTAHEARLQLREQAPTT